MDAAGRRRGGPRRGPAGGAPAAQRRGAGNAAGGGSAGEGRGGRPWAGGRGGWPAGAVSGAGGARLRRHRPRAPAVSPRADRAVRLRARAQLEPGRGEHPDDGAAARDGAVHPRRRSRTTTSSCCTPSRISRRTSTSRTWARPCLTGLSLQNAWNAAHQQTARWVRGSAAAGVPWVVANDEQGSASTGVPPDPGYPGFTGKDNQGNPVQSLHDIRKLTLWGNLMARRRRRRVLLRLRPARQRPHARELPQPRQVVGLRADRAELLPRREDSVLGHDERRPAGRQPDATTTASSASRRPARSISSTCPTADRPTLDLAGVTGQFNVSWFDPRNGGALKKRLRRVGEPAGRRRRSGCRPAARKRTGWLSSAAEPHGGRTQTARRRDRRGVFRAVSVRGVDPHPGSRDRRDLQPHRGARAAR